MTLSSNCSISHFHVFSFPELYNKKNILSLSLSVENKSSSEFHLDIRLDKDFWDGNLHGVDSMKMSDVLYGWLSEDG